MSKTSLFDLGPEKLNQLLSIGKKDQDASDDPKAAPLAPTSEAQKLTEQPGSWIGRYKMIRLLGEGGMGVVYLAEQEHPIKRQVALKIIKLGMDTKRVIARFEVERQALALLDHPNIAHVYDAGTTESGRPYFVMEYVSGLPITEHCDHHKLTIQRRLNLFMQVCQAIQHAHQKGIIHRDIKPSNILVASREGEAVPKIIDFGVAKAMAQPLTDQALETEQGQFFGTPEYMSPEQADRANEDIDTRSDVYSLGVLLYVLLTGCLPFESDTLREGGIEHIRKMIQETDPKTPSTRLTKLGEKATAIAQNRRMDIQTLKKHLRRELEWIPLKAMRKERSERYRSVSELADDIENYLADKPLIAGPLTSGYRLRKFLWRHKALVGGVAAVLIVSMIGAVVSLLFALGQARALTQAQLVEDYFRNDVLHVIARGMGREVTARDIMDVATKEIEGKFDDYPHVEVSIRRELATIYLWSLNDPKAAKRHMERIHSVVQQHPDVPNFPTNDLGVIYSYLGRYKEAEATFKGNLEWQRGLGKDELSLTFTKCNLAHLYSAQGRYEEAERLFVETREIALQANKESWARTFECGLARVYEALGKDDEAERIYMAGISSRKSEDDPNGLRHMRGLGRLRMAQGCLDEANDLLVKACEVGRKVKGDKHQETLGSIHRLALLRRVQGHYAEAEALFLEALNGRRHRLGEDHPNTLEIKNNLALLYKEQGNYAKAEPLLVEAVKGRRLKLGDTHPHTLESLNNLVALYEAWGKPEEVEEWRTKLPHPPSQAMQ